MALSEPKILSIKIDYELGKLSKTAICKKHKISRPTLRKHANDGKWSYQRTFKEVSKEVEKRTIERLLSDNTDIAVSTTDKFLKDSSNIRSVTVAVMDAMATELQKTNGNITAAEANRLLACQKVGEVSAKILTSLYTTTRKALGMDNEEDKGKEADSSIEDRIDKKMRDNGFIK